MTLILLLALQDVPISRIDKDRALYLTSVKEYTRSLSGWENDPKEALKTLDGMLANNRIQHRECTLRIENSDRTFTRHEFHPHRLRGRIRLHLSARAAQDDAIQLVRGAIDDFIISVDALPDLEAARTELGRLLGVNIKRTMADLRKLADSDDPDVGLAELEGRMREARRSLKGMDGMEREVTSVLVLAATLRRLYDGMTEEKIIEELREFRGKLGKVDLSAFGRKVRRVISALGQ